MTHVTVRGFTLKNNAQRTETKTKETVFSDNQAYLTNGLHIIEDCLFDGQNQVYDVRVPIIIRGTCINTIFRRNIVRDFTIHDASKKGRGIIFLTLMPDSGPVVGQPQITVADNTFYGNNEGCVFECMGDAAKQRYSKLVFERNTLAGNSGAPYSMVGIVDNPLSNTIRNNIFWGNPGNSVPRATLIIWNSNNTRVYHNTFFNNHNRWEVLVTTGSREGVEIKNNIFWPTPGGYCLEVQRGCTENVVCANNAFFTDFKNDGYPPGFGFSMIENTETVGLWDGEAMTTEAWNKASQNNTGNGYALDGPGLDKTLHLVAGSLCIDRGVSGLVSDDFDGMDRPRGAGYDIGADEYGTTSKVKSQSGEPAPQPQLDGQQFGQGSPISLAAYRGDLAKIEASMPEGVDINKLDGRGYAPLHYAAQNNQKTAMELLMAKGSDVNVKSSRGQTALFCAIAAGRRDVAELLISKGAAVNVTNNNDQAPLDFALSQNRPEMVELLIAKGAEISIHKAASLGAVDKVRSCLNKGADVQVKTTDEATPLHQAASAGNVRLVELLISKGAGVNAKDDRGETPLHKAVFKGRKAVVELLIARGADVNIRNNKDRTVLFLAEQTVDRYDIAEILRKHAARK